MPSSAELPSDKNGRRYTAKKEQQDEPRHNGDYKGPYFRGLGDRYVAFHELFEADADLRLVRRCRYRSLRVEQLAAVLRDLGTALVFEVGAEPAGKRVARARSENRLDRRLVGVVRG